VLFNVSVCCVFFFFSSRRRHTRSKRDWSSDVCSSDLVLPAPTVRERARTPKEAQMTNEPQQRTSLLNNKPSAIEDRRTRTSQWPMIIGLTFTWEALWQDISLSTIVLGVVVSLLVMLLLPLPPVPFANRFNLYHTSKFVLYFLWKITLATWDVAMKAIRPGPDVINSVVAVKLRTQDDLLLTLVGHVYA